MNCQFCTKEAKSLVGASQMPVCEAHEEEVLGYTYGANIEINPVTKTENS